VLVLLAVVSLALAQPEGINTGEGLQSLLFPGNGGIELAIDQSRTTLSQNLPLSFSFEAWVMLPNPPADGNYKTISARWDIGRTRDANNRWADWDFQVQASGTLNFFMGNGGPEMYGVLISAGNLVQGRWAHVAFTVSHPAGQAVPAFAQVFFDGNQFNRTWVSGTRQLNPNRNIFLGDYFNQDQDHKYWLGYMDEVRFWSGVRSGADFARFRQRVPASNTANLLAYYRFNDGAGLIVQDSTANKYDGRLSKVTTSTTSPLWRVSGAKINVDVTVAPGSISTIVLPGLSPSGTLAFTYAIASLPVAGVNQTGSGRLLADGQIITTTPFALVTNQVTFEAAPNNTLVSSFTYFGTYDIANPAQREPNPTTVFVQVGDLNCPRDACGQCNGDNSTCSCLPLPYNGYNLNDVQRILLLYEIEQTLDLLDGLQGKLEQTLKLLTAHQVSDLQVIITEVQLFGSSCLLAFCNNVSQYLDALAAIGPQ